MTGIDPDVERLSFAKEKYSANNITYQNACAEDIPGGNYDLIFSNSVLHWCKDKDLVFKQVARALKPGGKFGFVTPADFDVEEQFLTPSKMFTPECRKFMLEHVHHASSDTFKSLAAGNGLHVTYFSKHLQEWQFENVSKLIEFHMTHYKGHLSLKQFNLRAMKQHYGEGSISIIIPYITVLTHKI